MPGRDRGTHTALRSLAGALLATCLGGCGSVGDPLPPLLNVPRPVQDLAASQVAGEIHVQWTWPQLTTEGAVAREIGGFTLWAVDVPGFSNALTRETIDEYRRPVATLGPPELAGKEPGDRVTFRSSLSDWQLGQLTILTVSAASRSGRDAGYSNQVRLHPLEPPAEPQWLAVSVVPSGVALSWQAAERAEEYAIERAAIGEGGFTALGRLGVESFVDRTVEWDRSYSYRLRPYRLSEAGWIAGPASAASEVTPRDTFPPAPPRGLRAVRTPGSVELSWLPSPEADVQGYRVFRDGKDVTGLVPATEYSDGLAVRDAGHEYAVTAIDADGNESGPSDSLRVASTAARID